MFENNHLKLLLFNRCKKLMLNSGILIYVYYVLKFFLILFSFDFIVFSSSVKISFIR